jgi:hypothetical protein
VEVWAGVGVIGGQGGGAMGAGAGLRLVGPAEAETTGINIPLCSPTVSEAMISFICWAVGCGCGQCWGSGAGSFPFLIKMYSGLK